MGYSKHLLVDPEIHKEFLCAICEDVLQEVVMLDPCEHAFCKACIRTSYETSDKCPFDQKLIQKFKKPPPFFTNMLNDLQLYCAYKKDGCSQTLALEKHTDHGLVCEHNSSESEWPCPGACGAILTSVEKQGQGGTHDCVEFLKYELGNATTKLWEQSETIRRYQRKLLELVGPKVKNHDVTCLKRENIEDKFYEQIVQFVAKELGVHFPQNDEDRNVAQKNIEVGLIVLSCQGNQNQGHTTTANTTRAPADQFLASVELTDSPENARIQRQAGVESRALLELSVQELTVIVWIDGCS